MKQASVLCLLIALVCTPALAQSPIADLTPADVTSGQQLFENQCARCHSIGGAGGEGPPLTRPRLRHAADAAALFSVIKDGITGTGMPATWTMNDQEIWQVAGYVRSLSRIEPVSLPGDLDRGRALYQSNDCGTCHIAHGLGEGLGPELSEIGSLRGPAYLREALIDPAASHTGYLPVRLVTADECERNLVGN